MKIIISPAKKMNIQEDHPFEVTTPVFLEEAKELRKSLQTMDFKSLQSLWKCSEKLVRKNMEELLELDLTRQVTPCLLYTSRFVFSRIAKCASRIDRCSSY